tara:strand:+ start:347 stop:1372 length:1026 start_codon:yes stop_codon:yes gene_type:complete
MKLKNYLLPLDEEYYVRAGSDNIRVYGVGSLIKQIYSDLKLHRSIAEIERDFAVHQSFSRWILNRNGIAIQGLYALCVYWRGTCQKSESEFEQLWDTLYDNAEYFGSMNGKKIKLPKILDADLSYLLGVIFGDGHLADPDRSYDNVTTYNSELRITDQYRETFDVLNEMFRSLFDYTPALYSEQSNVGKFFYRFVIRSKPLHRFFMVVCGMPVGNKSGNLFLPEIIRSAPPELQKWFISGFFDADGCIPIIGNKRPVVQITQYDSEILKEIISMSSKLGINWCGPYNYKYQYNNCNIRINQEREIRQFLKRIPSLNPKKLEKREIAWQKLNYLENLRNTLH